MATNVIDQWGRGIAQGLSLGQQMLRQQELRSQQALRQLQERQIAQEMALQMQAHDLAIEERAEMSKAMARVQMEALPMLPAPADGPPEVGGQQPTAFLPNPAHVPLEQSLIKNVLPVVGKFRPKEVPGFVTDVARMQMAQEFHQPTASTVILPSGRRVEGVNTSRGHFQPIYSPEVLNMDVNGRQVPVITQGNTTRQVQPDIGARMGAAAANALAKEHAHLSIPNPNAPEGFRMIDPERWAEFEAQSKLTPKGREDMEQRIVKLQDTNRRLQSIFEKAETIFGPKALAGTIVVDRVLATLNPNLAEGQRIQGREAARYTMEGLVRSLTQGQGALSNQDVNRIYAMFPELGRPAELANNPKRSQQIIAGLQKQLALDEITDTQMLGRKPSMEALTYVDPQYLIEELRQGRIKPEIFRQAFNNNVHKAEVQALTQQQP